MVPSNKVLVHRVGDMTLFSVGQTKVKGTRDEEVESNGNSKGDLVAMET